MGGKINKSKLNFTIDIIMFVTLMAIAGIGFLIKYVLIPGFKRNEIYGKDVELFYGGLDRHQWGRIHLIISFVFLFLLLLHIVFHWKQIVSLSRRLIPVKYTRYFMVFSLLIVSLLLGLAPLFVQPQIQESSSHHHNQIADHQWGSVSCILRQWKPVQLVQKQKRKSLCIELGKIYKGKRQTSRCMDT